MSTTFGLDFNQSGYYDNHMDEETFGQRLKRLRDASGLGVRELARRAGIASHASISQAEKGRGWYRTPGPDVTVPLARALGVSHDELLGLVPGSSRTGEERVPYVVKRPPLTEAELYNKFGIRPYEEPQSVEGIALSAGPGKGIPQGLDDMMPRKVRGRKYLWEAPVVGDCMEDEIKPGEVVIYSTRLGAEIGKVMVAVRDEEELIIKRLKLVRGAQVLRPNKGADVPVDERIRFLGRGVSVQRPLL